MTPPTHTTTTFPSLPAKFPPNPGRCAWGTLTSARRWTLRQHVGPMAGAVSACPSLPRPFSSLSFSFFCHSACFECPMIRLRRSVPNSNFLTQGATLGMLNARACVCSARINHTGYVCVCARARMFNLFFICSLLRGRPPKRCAATNRWDPFGIPLQPPRGFALDVWIV